MAGETTNAAIRKIVIRKVLQNAGFAGFFEGFNPFRIGDEDLAARTADMPLICIQPTGLGSGAGDPGGWAWVWTPVSLLLLAFILWLFCSITAHTSLRKKFSFLSGTARSLFGIINGHYF